MKHYVGLDVSMKETFVCILDETGKVVREGRVKTDPGLIAGYLEKARLDVGGALTIDKVGIESGSISGWLVEQLKKLRVPATCIDARKMAAVLSVCINKTDKNDARGIADAMRSGLYREVIAKSPKSVETGTLMNSRRTMIEQKVQITNTIRGLLKTYGVRLGVVGESTFADKVKSKLSDQHPLAKQGIEGLLNCFEKLCEEIKKLTKKVEALAREDEDVARLMTIPGVGAITALAYKIEIDDPKRFKNSRAVGAYLGMTPRQYSSGETERRGKISKCGSREVRSLLNEAAVVMLTRSQRWSKLKAWGMKIARKRAFKQASMAVGRKLAVIMHKMLLNKTEFIAGEPDEQKLKAKEKIGTIGLARAI